MEAVLGDSINPEIGYFNHRRCNADWHIGEHVTDFYDVTYVIGGAANYMIEGERYQVTRGDFLCLPVGTRRSAAVDPDNLMECYAANFLIQGEVDAGELFRMPLINHVGVHMDVISLFEDLKNVWLRRNPGYMIRAKALLLLVLMRFFELISRKGENPVSDYRIEKTARYIVDHYHEHITIDSLANMIGLNRNYFGSLFKDTMGMTFRQFLTSIRLNRADSLLAIGKHSISEIALRCGFSDVCYFSRVYRKSRGIAPSQALRQRA